MIFRSLPRSFKPILVVRSSARIVDSLLAPLGRPLGLPLCPARKRWARGGFRYPTLSSSTRTLIRTLDLDFALPTFLVISRSEFWSACEQQPPRRRFDPSPSEQHPA